MHQIGGIPESGNSFTTPGLRFEVVDMDGNRVDKILIVKTGDKTIPLR